jgi:hypothetical protein
MPLEAPITSTTWFVSLTLMPEIVARVASGSGLRSRFRHPM